jgi:hypothetical protein
MESSVRAAHFISALMLTTLALAGAVNAQNATPSQSYEGGPPVPPVNEPAVIGNYCVHRNLLYSLGDVLCLGGQGLVCAPASGPATGARAYWSSVPVNRGDINWAPPAHCGK